MLGGILRGQILWLRERHEEQVLEQSGMHILESWKIHLSTEKRPAGNEI